MCENRGNLGDLLHFAMLIGLVGFQRVHGICHFLSKSPIFTPVPHCPSSSYRLPTDNNQVMRTILTFLACGCQVGCANGRISRNPLLASANTARR